ncbi:MAG TPA: isoprenylcysteine carboxylmethyltransferase family protein [Rhizomicrobium sp.]|nr:isoprenylcysteine carboxylmethyltransferase family protein [Rhizomicrobium sp.]
MTKFFSFLYGVVAYVVFFATFLYAVGFVDGLVVPKTIDTVAFDTPIGIAVVINFALMAAFAIQHSVMARTGFKAFVTRCLPRAIERSTYVLLASLLLLLLFWQWRAIPAVVWRIDDPVVARAVLALSLFGWAIVLFSTFLINHFELFGLHQVANNLTGQPMPQPRFRTPLLYKLVRHPLYLGFFIAFWAAPVMTQGHLLFAAVTTAYVFFGILLEERDLVALFGEEYRAYRKRVPMVLPWPR